MEIQSNTTIMQRAHNQMGLRTISRKVIRIIWHVPVVQRLNDPRCLPRPHLIRIRLHPMYNRRGGNYQQLLQQSTHQMRTLLNTKIKHGVLIRSFPLWTRHGVRMQERHLTICPLQWRYPWQIAQLPIRGQLLAPSKCHRPRQDFWTYDITRRLLLCNCYVLKKLVVLKILPNYVF